jgi:hypothetical protein
LEGTPGTQSNACLVGSNSIRNGFSNFKTKPGAVLNATTPFVRPLIADVLCELID